eukprot:1275894-Rhodomonas_salina.7
MALRLAPEIAQRSSSRRTCIAAVVARYARASGLGFRVLDKRAKGLRGSVYRILGFRVLGLQGFWSRGLEFRVSSARGLRQGAEQNPWELGLGFAVRAFRFMELGFGASGIWNLDTRLLSVPPHTRVLRDVQYGHSVWYFAVSDAQYRRCKWCSAICLRACNTTPHTDFVCTASLSAYTHATQRPELAEGAGEKPRYPCDPWQQPPGRVSTGHGVGGSGEATFRDGLHVLRRRMLDPGPLHVSDAPLTRPLIYQQCPIDAPPYMSGMPHSGAAFNDRSNALECGVVHVSGPPRQDAAVAGCGHAHAAESQSSHAHSWIKTHCDGALLASRFEGDRETAQTCAATTKMRGWRWQKPARCCAHRRVRSASLDGSTASIYNSSASEYGSSSGSANGNRASMNSSTASANSAAARSSPSRNSTPTTFSSASE